MGVIFDLDQTIIDSSIAEEERKKGNWAKVYSLIPFMKPYYDVVSLIHALLGRGIQVAIVTSSPRTYCEKVLRFLDITGVITVCYHDTNRHKPDPEPIWEAIRRMENQEGKNIIAIGDDDKDTLAANRAGVISIQGFWGNPNGYRTAMYKPSVFCEDEESLLRYFQFCNIDMGIRGLRHRVGNTYQLFDYYPKSRQDQQHDVFSEEILQEVKGWNNRNDMCREFCKRFSEWEMSYSTYGIFVVPSSTAGKWNSKLTDYVVPQLVESKGLIDCSKHILRHTTHDKQAFGGNRSVLSNLSTIKLQYKLPEHMEGAFIIDDITTTGNIFEACKRVLCAEGIPRENIYCAAIGGTI